MSSQFEKIKHWPWKRIMIGTAVISSIAASSSFGTYAYFTSQAQETNAFTAGKLEIGLGTTATSFQAEGDDPFLPGVRFEKSLRINNLSDVPVKYALLANKEDGDDIVYDQLMVEVRRGGADGDLLYMGRVSQLTRSNVIISELEKDGGDELHFAVYLPESTGNEVQQKSASVEFGFLATQIGNGEYFAQSGPVMTLTPNDFEEGILKATERVMKDTVQGTTFILAEGNYSLPNGFAFPANSAWKAEKGKEGKVVLDADGLTVKDVSFDGLAFSGSGVGLYVDSNVSIANSIFTGYEAAIQTSPGGSEERKDKSKEQKGDSKGPKADSEDQKGDSKGRKGLTVKNSKFQGVDQGIVLDQEIKAVVIAGNTFENVGQAVSATGEEASEIQIVANDFTKVSGYAVDSDGVRIGDGIEGFREATGENNTGEGKLALHIQNADFYLEGNKYK